MLGTTWLRVTLLAACVLCCSSMCAPYAGFQETRGQKTFVCMVFSTLNTTSGATTNNSFVIFSPTGDSYSRLALANSYNSFPADTFVALESTGGTQSLQKKYVGLSSVTNMLTAIVTVKEGIVQGIQWDDGCHTCNTGSATCETNTYVKGKTVSQKYQGESCYTSKVDCDKNPSACDLQIYTVWQGTDKYGNYYKSHGKRFSLFRKFSTEDISQTYANAVHESSAEIAATSEKI